MSLVSKHVSQVEEAQVEEVAAGEERECLYYDKIKEEAYDGYRHNIIAEVYES